MLTHVVMFKLRDRSPEHAAHCKALLDALPPVIPEIKRFDVGVNMIDSARAYDLVLIAEFDDEEAMRRYQHHPDHAEAVAYLRDNAEAAAAVDFVSP